MTQNAMAERSQFFISLSLGCGSVCSSSPIFFFFFFFLPRLSLIFFLNCVSLLALSIVYYKMQCILWDIIVTVNLDHCKLD